MNVLILVLDAARRDRFGCYGYSRGTTPAIDELSRNAAVFEQMISPSSWTIPSHAGLFTGLYPRENGTHRLGLALRPGHITLAQHLQRYGYTTAFVSNNPLISQRLGLIDERSIVVGRRQLKSNSRGSLTRTLVRRLSALTGSMDNGAVATNRVVIDLLSRLPDPCFIFVNYMECHWAYTATRPFEQRFVRRHYSAVEAALRRVWMRRHHAWEPGAVRNDDDLGLVNDLYDGAVAYLDSRVGDLLEVLDATGQAERTILIVMADHGEVIGDYGWIGHGMHLYDTLVHVPFIARIPGREAGRIRALTQLTDVFSGLCGVLGLEFPCQIQNRPFAVDPFGLHTGDPGREYAFAEFHQMSEKQLQRRRRIVPDFQSSPNLEMAQDTRFKLLVEPDARRESFFDLEADPEERSPLAEGLPAERARLTAALDQWRRLFPAIDARTYSLEEERILNARLEELGYV